MTNPRIAIVGAGVFGVTAALALRARGHDVLLCDPGPLPHPLAASTDVSKVIRLDYGADAEYTALMERALDGWRGWNSAWSAPLFHETGVAFLCRGPMTPGRFEHDSYELLRARGHRPERVGIDEIRRRFPAWNADRFVDGYVNPEGGYAESGPVVARLVEEARGAGVRLLTGVTFARLAVRGSRVRGIVSTDGAELAAEGVVMATGAWTPHALPFLADHLRSVGQPVFHLAPPQAAPFQAARFPVFGADITATGYYGFPATGDGVVKIANHGVGRVMHPESSERAVTAEETARLRAFLREAFPGLAGAPIVSTRVCLYCDTRDGHFWIARDPDRDGLVVATGDSGHAFKFAPVLGDLIADVVDDVPTPILQKFRWRPEVRPARPHEAARHHGAR